MNESSIVKIIQKSVTTLALLLVVVFIGMMTVILISGLIEQAQAYTFGRAISHYGIFSDIKWHIETGKFIHTPTLGHEIHWETRGGNIIGGDERGWVSAKVGPSDNRIEIKFHFFNPNKGTNTCYIETPPNIAIHTTCHITQQTGAQATFVVSPSN